MLIAIHSILLRRSSYFMLIAIHSLVTAAFVNFLVPYCIPLVVPYADNVEL